ncbi:MAG: hypothetical protein AMJ90_02355 [candidate division Zixibacteria bacterium SM23_73_2]|nr:MAG: hypothetical protein AMJ90_02355 [candidate division Zixibacteria bacterium SM23_73_2]
MKLSRLEKTIAILCFILILLHFIASFFPEKRLWGINHLAYFSLSFRIIILFLGLLLLVLVPKSTALDRYKLRLPHFAWIGKLKYLRYIIVSLIFLVIFWLLRTKTYLLGDGYLRAKEISTGARPFFTEFLDLSLHSTLYGFFHQIFNWDAYTTYAFVSVVCGAVFVFFVFLLGDMIGRSGRDKMLILVLLVFSGGTQLFLGYVESYTILYLAILLYIYFSIGYLNGKNSLILPCFVLLISGFFHISALVLFPSFLFLLLIKNPTKDALNPEGIILQKILCVVIIVISTILGFLLFKFYPLKGSEQKISHFLIAFWGSGKDLYSLFSLNHLLDVINQQFLVASLGILIWAAIFISARKKINIKSNTSRFFFLVTIFSLAFALLVDPVLGYARDWDLFAFTGLGYTIWAIYLMVDLHEKLKNAKYVVLALTITLLTCSLPWFLLNADISKSVRRFENLLGLYQRGKSYGYETLSICYRELGMTEREMEELEKTITLEKNPRNIVKLGVRYFEIGEVEKGISLFENAIRIDPNASYAHNNLGLAYLKKGLLDEAISEFKSAIRSKPTQSSYYVNLGDAFSEKGLFEESIEQYEKAKRLDPENPEAHHRLGLFYAKEGLLHKAIESFKNSIELKNDYVRAYYDLGITYLEMENINEAILIFQKALKIKPHHAQTHFALGFALTRENLPQEAIQHLKLYLESSEDTARKEEARDLIKKLEKDNRKEVK